MKLTLISKFIYFILFCMISCNAYAGSLDTNYIATVAMKAPEWAISIQPMAVKLFLLLWWLETMLQAFSTQLLQIGKVKELLRFVIVRSLFMGFFSVFLTNPNFYLAIPTFFAKLSGVNDIRGSGILGVNPGDVWQSYANWFSGDYTSALDANSTISKIGVQLSLAIGAIMYMIATIYISFLIIMLNIEVYVMIYGALILTACAGSKWTYGWWASYLGAVVSIGLKILLFLLLYKILGDSMKYHSGSTFNSIDVWTQIVNCILCTLTLGIIPSKIAGIVSSAGTGELGGQVVGGFMGGLAFGMKTMGGIHATAGAIPGAAKGAFKTGKGAFNMGAGAVQMSARAIGGAIGSVRDGLSENMERVQHDFSLQPRADSQDKSSFLNDK